MLFVPKQTFATLNDVPEASALVIGRLATAAARYAKAQGFAEEMCIRDRAHSAQKAIEKAEYDLSLIHI